MPDQPSAEATARRKSGRRRMEKVSDGAPTAMLALMSALALSGALTAWYLNSKTAREAPTTASTQPAVSTQPASPHALQPEPSGWQPPSSASPAAGLPGDARWVDLAEGDGPPPSPPEDRTANMVLIPAGKFLYGEESQEVDLPAFYIDRCEVSQAEYAQFLRYVRLTGNHSRCRADEPPNKDHTPLNWGRPDITDPRYPVVGVDYWDVWAYAGWVGKRLPTEEEWEKAARGTDGRLYPWGEEWDERLCNWGPTPGNPRTLLPVDSMPDGKSPFGCLHMLGNAAEWTGSFIDEPRHVHCGRGYCWRIGHMIPYRTTYRMPGPTNLRDEGSGLRCALDAEGEKLERADRAEKKTDG
ncbi:MAG TPA: SUMF1/EgtB/PvdO family nonheme iron enzyme [Pirellulales bacterium]|nr:SUMF1/EgtB/PvdO family nonheme iron enzyme [Pirellulales bacterium]